MNNQNHKSKKRNNKEKKEEKNIIITYSMIEQGKNNIMGIGKCLLCFVGVFPFIPFFLMLFSCYVKLIPHKIYTGMFFGAAILCVIVMLIYMTIWLKNVMTVFLIDEHNDLYRLKISVFWYKIKNKMYLLNPGGMAGGRLMRMFYMFGNIKLVLESATEDITFDEFITMGKMERLSDITDVNVSGKRITFCADITSQKGVSRQHVTLFRAFEQCEQFCAYLKKYEKEGVEATSSIVFDGKNGIEELILKKSNDSAIKKLSKFIVTWTCIMAWIAAFMLSGDLGRLSKINAGEYVLVQEEMDNAESHEIYVNVNNPEDTFRKTDYGKLYKPILILYISPIFVYSFMKVTDIAIERIKKKE